MASRAQIPGEDLHHRDVVDRHSKLTGAIITFRRFRVVPGSRTFAIDGKDVDIGGRAFDLLVVLLEARGSVVDKSEIMRRVWPSLVVDESNLRFQMAKLRKILGRDRDAIKTVAGRGYLLADDVNGSTGDLPTIGCPEPDEDAELKSGHAWSKGAERTSANDRIRFLERENRQLRLALADAAINRYILASASYVDQERT